MRSYLVLCLAVSAVVCLAVLFVPGVSETVERLVLGFLSRNAR
jgi:hypothetical protein